jgi:gluconate 2-dehydrogenase gamma chain
MQDALSRRLFLFHSASCVSATWVATHWPAALAAAQHAHNSAQSAAPPTFEFFTPDLAKEVDAVAPRIIPTDQTPGAREAGVVYFIDRALATFASGDRKLYTEGIAEMQARASEMFPGLEKFSAATDGQPCCDWNSTLVARRAADCLRFSPCWEFRHFCHRYSGRPGSSAYQ